MAIVPEAGVRTGLAKLGLELSDTQVGQLLAYAELLDKWSRVYNLTALRGPDEILTHHLLDCLALIGPLRRHTAGTSVRVLDVGAGAGLPGVVIAIACPELSVDCVDAVAKKAAFVQQVAATLALENLRGVHARVEDLGGDYAVITSRAFASLGDFVQVSADALGEGGVWVAMKGKYPETEIAALPPGIEMFHVEQLKVPGLQADRCLIWLRRQRA
jgi:16S rRNA (guanine527-N7)-methyltransferase